MSSDQSQSRRRFLRQAAALGLTLKTLTANSAPAQNTQSTPDMPQMSGQMGNMHQTATPNKPANNGSSMPSNAIAPPRPMLHVLELPPFVDPLPLPQKAQSIAAPGHPPTVQIHMREIHAKVHRDVPPTRMWSYGDTALAPLIEAHANHPLRVQWFNDLPTKHFLPVDHSLHGCGKDRPEVRAIVHVHGARVATKDDGHPDDWYPSGQSLTCTYPLQQDSTALWYHDHAMGLNRLNVYAGLFGLFLLRDPHESALNLPAGPYEIPLILYDRNFLDDGQLYYPTSGDPDHPWVSEFAGDAILINGKIRPYLEVEPRLYRIRLVNAANSRFFRLSFHFPESKNPDPAAQNQTHTSPATFHQIGSDQGLLAAPVPLTVVTYAPGERADLLVDFSHAAGQNVHLRNNALDILQFRVAAKPSSAPPARLPTTLRPIPRTPEHTATTTRTITLNEYQDKVGNSMVMLLNRKAWHEPTTETPRLNTTEIWEFVNLTEDVHPMHLHLVRFQILDRRTIDVFQYMMYKKLHFNGPAVPPEPPERGWKDVVQCSSGDITRVIVKFEGFTGNYLYHCHILEHEANDMMRPFEVIA